MPRLPHDCRGAPNPTHRGRGQVRPEGKGMPSVVATAAAALRVLPVFASEVLPHERQIICKAPMRLRVYIIKF